MHTHQALIVIVGAYSTGQYLAPSFISRGYQCIHVQPGAKVLPYFLSGFRQHDFIKHLIWDANDEAIIQELVHLNIKAVLPGSEVGVLLADRLSQKLMLPTSNHQNFNSARRNKYDMQKMLEQAGLKAIPVCKTHNSEAMFAWMNDQNIEYPIVIKPLSSAGTDGVTICQNKYDAEMAFKQLIDTVNALGDDNSELLVQPYIHGTEYVVNTASYAGTHYVTDMIRVNKITSKGSPVYDYAELLCPVEHAALYTKLGEYVKKSLDALGIKYGAGHSEVMLMNDVTPVLIETAARPIGGIDLAAYTEALGYNHISAITESYLNPDHFYKVFRPEYQLPLRKRLLCTFMISPVQGTICNIPNIQPFQQLPDFYGVRIQTEGILERTKTLINCPGFVNLVGENQDELLQQHHKIRQYEPQLFSQMIVCH